MTTGEQSAAPQLGEPTIGELRHALRGELITPTDPAYDTARGVWNGMIDRRPALIARCSDAGDVATAIGFARSEGLTVAVRGGAHNVAGNATCDGGLVIDLSTMKGIRIDRERTTVRAEAGLTWGELDAATQALGLATTGGLVSSTGIAGFTLGGGVGWLMRRHGLACDNLIGADMVTADGAVLHASEADQPDVLWGLRGGGGNFGVVTEFEYRLHPVSTVLGGLVAWPAHRAGDVLRFWREWAREAPADVCTLGVFLYAPPEPFIPPEAQGTPIFAIAVCHIDPDGRAEDDLRELRAFGPPVVDVIGPMPYTALQGMFDAGAPAGLQNYWKSSYLAGLDDATIDVILGHTTSIPAPFGQVHLHQLGGAVGAAQDSGASGHRGAGFLLNIVGTWADPAETERGTAWVRGFAAAVEPHAMGAYVNFMGDEGDARIRAAYEPATFARLRELKAQLDPTNVFRLNQNVPPAR